MQRQRKQSNPVLIQNTQTLFVQSDEAFQEGFGTPFLFIVKDGSIIARAHNLKEEKNKATAHAEIMAIEKACKKLDNWRLDNCELYITLEPCEMCKSIIKKSRIEKVYYYSTIENSISIIILIII